MKKLVLILLVLVSFQTLTAQQADESSNFYLGVSYGRSFLLGDFGDTDFNNPDAGFAQDGNKFDLYCGYKLNEQFTLTGLFRYQTFETEIDNIIADLNANNPGANFSGSTEDWKTYSLLIGAAYHIKIAENLVYPHDWVLVQ